MCPMEKQQSEGEALEWEECYDNADDGFENCQYYKNESGCWNQWREENESPEGIII